MEGEDSKTDERLVVTIGGGDGGEIVKKEEDDIVWVLISSIWRHGNLWFHLSLHREKGEVQLNGIFSFFL